jgi:hypothetical protein
VAWIRQKNRPGSASRPVNACNNYRPEGQPNSQKAVQQATSNATTTPRLQPHHGTCCNRAADFNNFHEDLIDLMIILQFILGKIR